VPGETATLVAPVVTQLSVLLEPDLTLAGLAEKDVTVGAEPGCGLLVDGTGLLVEPPHPVRAADARRTTAAAQKPSPARTELTFRLAEGGGERKRNPSVASPFMISARLYQPQAGLAESRNTSRILCKPLLGRRFATRRTRLLRHPCAGVSRETNARETTTYHEGSSGLSNHLFSRHFRTADGARLLHGRIPAADDA
jgi:hypothetical protein